MPNRTFQDNACFSRPPCAQQANPQQFPTYSNHYNNQSQNVYDYVYSAPRNQYPQPTTNLYEHMDSWLPDPRIVSDLEKGLKFTDKIETIEISSKDLSPASCCSNIDLLLPDIYKSNKPESSQWCYTGKSYAEYPSCSQVQDCSVKPVKYCNIQKSSFGYDQYAGLFNSDDVQEILQFDPVPGLDHRSESSNGSDIIVEESDDEYAEKFNCVVCNDTYSALGSQYYYVTPESPLTMSSQKPVYGKLKDLMGDCLSGCYLCSQCLGLINTIDHLELKLDGCKTELMGKLGRSPSKEPYCNHRFDCAMCKRVFTLSGVYKNHMNRHKVVNRFLCEVCGKCFAKLGRFRLHARTHRNASGTKVKQVRIVAFQCKICNKAFRRRSNLKEHENYCSGRLPYKCRTCGKKFATPTKLRNHTRLKHDKKFTSICSICNIGFVKVSDHKAHMISHTSDKKFQCDKCDRSYKTPSNLRFHMKFHESRLPFGCAVCGKGFMRREYLEAHTSTHTGERNFPCAACDRRFGSQKHLDAHAKCHDTAVKKKSCNVCGKLISKNLEDHMRTHANLKEFECDACDSHFNTRNALLKHKKRKHEL